jgi:hypothetical protein
MVRHMLLRSRHGNLVLAAIGALYALASLAVLIWFVIDVWNAAGLADHLVQAALFASIVCGIWFISIGYSNLHPQPK